MSLVQQYSVATDETFRQRVQVAMVIAARDIQGEAIGAVSVAHYQKRQQLARSIILGPLGYVERFAWLCAANPGLIGTPTDSDIQFTVNTVWDDAAGVDATDG